MKRTIIADAKPGHNKPPRQTPLQKFMAETEAMRAEFDNWLDGAKVENADQMAVVDDLIAKAKGFEKALGAIKEKKYRPAKKKLDEITAEFKGPLDDLKRQRTGLLAIVGDFKIAERKRVEEETRLEQQRARAEVEAARKEQQNVDRGDIEASRAVDDFARDARAKQRDVNAVAKEKKVTGVRTVYDAEITDRRAVLNWIAQNDPSSLSEFLRQYVNTVHRKQGREASAKIDGVQIKERQIVV